MKRFNYLLVLLALLSVFLIGYSSATDNTVIGTAIIGVNELNFKGDIVISYLVSQWQVNAISSTSYLYSSFIMNNGFQTNITALFYESSVGEYIYSVNVTQYNFASSLNNLEIVLFKDSSSYPSAGPDFIKFTSNLYGKLKDEAIVDGILVSTQNSLVSSPQFNGAVVVSIKLPYFIQSANLYQYITIYTIQDTSNNSSSSSGSNETVPPVRCINNCSDHGFCSTNGCVCYEPWIGLDCSSQVIVIDPVINTTTPSTNTTVDQVNGTAIVALNELNLHGDIVLSYIISQWQVNAISNTSWLYSSSIMNNGFQTNITALVNQVNVGEYTYSVNITKYTFASSLNNLELILFKGSSNYTTAGPDFIKFTPKLYGKLKDLAYFDGRLVSTQNNLVSSPQFNGTVVVSIRLPYFIQSANLDQYISIYTIQNSSSSSSSSNGSSTNSSSSNESESSRSSQSNSPTIPPTLPPNSDESNNSNSLTITLTLSILLVSIILSLI